MRKLLILVLLAVFFIPAWFANTQEDIQSIPNGDSYQIRIDNFLNKRNQDVDLLQSMKVKLSRIAIPVSHSEDNQRYLRILIDYIIEKIDGHLQAHISFQESVEPEPEETILETPTVAKKVLAPASLNLERFEDNPRTILAWKSAAIYEADIVSNLESIDVGEVIFTIRSIDADIAERVIKNASIYIDSVLIDTNTNADIRETSSGRFDIEFSDLDNFIVTEQEQELHLVIHTETVGFQRIWQTLQDFFVEQVSFEDGQWQTSNQDVNPTTITQVGNSYSILPGIINTTVTRGINTGLVSEFELFFDTGANASTANNSTPNASLDSIIFDITGSNFWANTPEFFLENTDGGNDVITGIISGNKVVFDTTQFSFSNRFIPWNTTEAYEMTIGGVSSNATIFLDIESDGISYSITNVDNSNNLNIDLRQDISLGSRTIR